MPERDDEITTAKDGRSKMNFHNQYAQAVGEIHGRPMLQVDSQSTILHYAFMSEAGASVSRAILADICKKSGSAVPDKRANYFNLKISSGSLSWEGHSEFTSFTFVADEAGKFGKLPNHHPFSSGFSQPGSIISACQIDIIKLNQRGKKLLEKFDRDSLCISVLEDGKSLLATDFRQNTSGFTQYLLLEADMAQSRIGYYTKLALEIETYRTLAMLGLPLARQLSPRLSRAELELERLTIAVRNSGSVNNEKLLSEINNLAAHIEADSAASLFRFGASQAYGSIVQDRLESLGNTQLPGFMRITRFVNRSLLPALRTCNSVKSRQADLSRKLARIANLLRTRVEVEIENQNRNLLASMDKRAKLQLRLQQTVEGLSVAAVTYYIVGLFYYLMQAVEKYSSGAMSAKLATGFFVPIALMFVWLVVRHIRRHHFE